MPKMEPVLRKSKLVVISATVNVLDNSYPFFAYHGFSSSQNVRLQASIQSREENLMFYEHFDDINAESPSQLAFMFIGGTSHISNKLETFYPNVSKVDISNDFDTVKSLFIIASKLPNCVDLKIHLSSKNIRSTQLLSAEEFTDVHLLCFGPRPAHVSNTSLKSLRIIAQHGIDAAVLNGFCRFDVIVTHAYYLTPKLEKFEVKGIKGTGKIYELLNYFLTRKPNLPMHDLTLKGGKCTVQPAFLPDHHREDLILGRDSPLALASTSVGLERKPGNEEKVIETESGGISTVGSNERKILTPNGREGLHNDPRVSRKCQVTRDSEQQPPPLVPSDYNGSIPLSDSSGEGSVSSSGCPNQVAETAGNSSGCEKQTKKEASKPIQVSTNRSESSHDDRPVPLMSITFPEGFMAQNEERRAHSRNRYYSKRHGHYKEGNNRNKWARRQN